MGWNPLKDIKKGIDDLTGKTSAKRGIANAERIAGETAAAQEKYLLHALKQSNVLTDRGIAEYRQRLRDGQTEEEIMSALAMKKYETMTREGMSEYEDAVRAGEVKFDSTTKEGLDRYNEIMSSGGAAAERATREGISSLDPYAKAGSSAIDTLMQFIRGERTLEISSMGQLQQKEATKAMQQQAAATGSFGSGRTQRMIGEQAGMIAAQDAENQYSRLGNIAQMGQQATGAQLSALQGLSSNLFSQSGNMAANTLGTFGQIASNQMSAAGNIASARSLGLSNIAAGNLNMYSNMANLRNQTHNNMASAGLNVANTQATNLLNTYGALAGVQGGLGADLANAAIARGSLSGQIFKDTLGAVTSLASAAISKPPTPGAPTPGAPTPAPYDYGQGGQAGIPWRPSN